MAVLQANGKYLCRACERGELEREDFYTDNSKKHNLSRFCRACEGDRTREAKRQHYQRSERHKQAARRKTKRGYYLRNREEIMSKSTIYKRNNPGKIRGYILRRKYKITTEERDAMIAEQQGLCEICGAFQGEKLEIDHNHTTGRVRALLCHKCNSGLGMFGDNFELLSIARSYLYHYNQD